MKKIGKTIMTNNPKITLRTQCHRSCNAIRGITNIMEQVIEMKENGGNGGKYLSIRTPEDGDKIMKSLVYILRLVADGLQNRAT